MLLPKGYLDEQLGSELLFLISRDKIDTFIRKINRHVTTEGICVFRFINDQWVLSEATVR